MLADAFGQLGMVARKLGIARDEARIRRAVEFSSFKALQAQEAQSGFIEKSLHSRRFFRAGRAGGWREVLAPAQAAMMDRRSEEHTSEIQSLMRRSYAVFCLKKKN